jgi:hypothetical protein
MTAPKRPDGRRFLVVSDQIIVGEDLRDLLHHGGWGDADVLASLDAPWDGPYCAAFLDAPLESVVDHHRIQRLRRGGTVLVVFDDRVNRNPRADPAIRLLSKPFCTRDILQALNGLGVTADAP